MKTTVRDIELLAPARDAEVALAAIACGADAVYIGAPSHGARAAAAVTLADIRRVVEAAHPFGVRVYVALNTLVYDDELPAVERMARDLYDAGVDALIVQDMALTQMKLPPIALHASTQCDIRTPDKAAMLAAMGFTRIVVARELSADETAAIHRRVPDTEIESFVHGALCVSYSGDCRASFAATGRSANRGECSQMCRHSYDLLDRDGRVLVADKYLLSLRDLNRSARLGEMLEAGVCSFKIEGRLKDAAYVMETVGHYRRLLDRLIEANPDKYRRASWGSSQLSFTPDASLAFNRGFTEYFTRGSLPGGSLRMATLDSPGRLGTPVGRVAGHTRGGALLVDLTDGVTLANGDGLSWTDSRTGATCGMRVNRVEGRALFPAPGTTVLPAVGTQLRRTSDTARDRLLARPGAARRSIAVDAILRMPEPSIVALDLSDERGCSVTATLTLAAPAAPADKPQQEPRLRTVGKTGDTIYTLRSLDDRVGQLFIPASELTRLRREAFALLDMDAAIRFRPMLPGKSDPAAAVPAGVAICNVANRLSRQAYGSIGAAAIEEAAETAGIGEGDIVMTTRYCLRRELGHCLLTPEGRRWKGPLTLRDASGTAFTVDFDCQRCGMTLRYQGKR